MNVYLAFNDCDALRVEELGTIPCKWFPLGGKYVPLAESLEVAMEKALSATEFTTNSMNAAIEPTQWYVLEMTFSTEQALELFNSQVLWRYTGGRL